MPADRRRGDHGRNPAVLPPGVLTARDRAPGASCEFVSRSRAQDWVRNGRGEMAASRDDALARRSAACQPVIDASAEEQPTAARKHEHVPPASHVGRARAVRPAPCAAPMRSRGWPSACSNLQALRPFRRNSMKSSSPWTQTCSRTGPRGDARSSTAAPSRPRPRVAFAVTGASSRAWTARGGSRPGRAGATVPFPRRFAGRCTIATAAAAFLAVRPPTGCTGITCGTLRQVSRLPEANNRSIIRHTSQFLSQHSRHVRFLNSCRCQARRPGAAGRAGPDPKRARIPAR